jgi:hypothetical protein
MHISEAPELRSAQDFALSVDFDQVHDNIFKDLEIASKSWSRTVVPCIGLYFMHIC